MNGLGFGLIGALVLGALGASAVAAQPSAQLHRLSPSETTVTTPALPDWTATTAGPAPETTPHGRITALAAADLVELRMFRKHGQDRAPADRTIEDRVLVLSHGSLDLGDLSEAAAATGLVHRRGAVVTIKAPLLIRGDATLAIRAGEWLRLDGRAGAFEVNAGRLIARGARISSWDSVTGTPMPSRHDRRFRPFIAAINGSWTDLGQTTISHLGYDAAKAYGITLATAPGARPTMAPPSGRLIGNRVVGNFYGFYSHEAEDVVIAGNLFRDSVKYGIDPHDRSRRLLIADNVVTTTRRKHGIVLSREVVDSWVIGNWSIDNAGTGIMLDRAATDNVIARNLVSGNGADGISLLESPRNHLFDNLVIGNAKP